MLKASYSKIQLVNHIRRLFKLRSETLWPSDWDCVLRNGRLIVIRSFLRESDDLIIMHYYLETGHLPSFISTYIAVLNNWRILRNASVDVSRDFGIGHSFLAITKLRKYHKRCSWLSHFRGFLRMTNSPSGKKVHKYGIN